ncbi:DEAD/DEAH box helicase [bacterium]|nr:DEAD/DEAH box helicase [bacterium]
MEFEPLLGIWTSAVQVHPYQLVPVVRALQMPRVSLLLADGVGLGKTIQSGLILQELILRRKIRRVLILCPALLQRQWKREMSLKFNLEFDIIDSESTFEIRRRLGIDTNPWKAFPRIITSMDYLRMPDVLQQFVQASGIDTASASSNGHDAPAAPWDLLVVDECHNFAPQNSRRASQRHQMLREIRFLFEHRLFLSATPHNGKTVSFTGLLELLDPVRFQIHAQMSDHDRVNLEEVKVRRLKEDIKKYTLRPPFSDFLDPKEIAVDLTSAEVELFTAMREYRKHGQAYLESSGNAQERWMGHFVFSVLTKRLLSGSFAFARTWWRHYITCLMRSTMLSSIIAGWKIRLAA